MDIFNTLEDAIDKKDRSVIEDCFYEFTFRTNPPYVSLEKIFKKFSTLGNHNNYTPDSGRHRILGTLNRTRPHKILEILEKAMDERDHSTIKDCFFEFSFCGEPYKSLLRICEKYSKYKIENE